MPGDTLGFPHSGLWKRLGKRSIGASPPKLLRTVPNKQILFCFSCLFFRFKNNIQLSEENLLIPFNYFLINTNLQAPLLKKHQAHVIQEEMLCATGHEFGLKTFPPLSRGRLLGHNIRSHQVSSNGVKFQAFTADDSPTDKREGSQQKADKRLCRQLSRDHH